MRRAAIVAPVRTPVGVYGKALRSVPAEDLAAAAVRAVIGRSGIDPQRVEDVSFAQSYANSETPCVGRWVALHARLPEHVAGTQVDRRCGGGLQAVVNAAMMIQTRAADVVLAGGVESMSRIEHYSLDVRWGARSGGSMLHDRLDRGRERAQPEWRHGRISGMIETAENVARKYGITRAASDEFAAASQAKAAAAWDSGRFDAEIVPVTVPPARRGEQPAEFSRDEGVRPGTTVETLSRLQAIMPDGVVTAGNAAQQNDAAAACLVVAEDLLDELGLTASGFLVDWAAVGCDPAMMGLGPVPAVARLFKRTGLGFGDMRLVELNEAFACQVLAATEGWGWQDFDRLNVNGSGISLGHPIGATGVRMMVTMLHELGRRGGGLGLETMCIGGGQGMAAIFEAPASALLCPRVAPARSWSDAAAPSRSSSRITLLPLLLAPHRADQELGDVDDFEGLLGLAGGFLGVHGVAEHDHAVGAGGGDGAGVQRQGLVDALFVDPLAGALLEPHAGAADAAAEAAVLAPVHLLGLPAFLMRVVAQPDDCERDDAGQDAGGEQVLEEPDECPVADAGDREGPGEQRAERLNDR
jgi:acetyl-CoA C-acetyltransferase